MATRKLVYVAGNTGTKSNWYEIMEFARSRQHDCAFEALVSSDPEVGARWHQTVHDSVRTADAVIVLLSTHLDHQRHAIACAREYGKRIVLLSAQGDDCTFPGPFRSPVWTIELQSVIDGL